MKTPNLSVYKCDLLARRVIQTTLRKYFNKPSGFGDQILNSGKFKDIVLAVEETILDSLDEFDNYREFAKR